jgi:hypothetical protein
MSRRMFSSNLRIGCWKFSTSSARKRLICSPVPGAKERIVAMLARHVALTEDVTRLEGLVEEQRKELEMQNSSRFGGMYDDDESILVTMAMVDAEEEQVHQLEEKIKMMQEQVSFIHPMLI